jgi:hypothetical protein
MENSYRFVPCSIPQGEFYFEIGLRRLEENVVFCPILYY